MTERVHLVDATLAAALINAETVAETESAIAAFERSVRGCSWRPVGDIEFNHGPAQIGIDPATQLIERVINAQEACIELEAYRRQVSPSSPQEAASLFFNVPPDGLAAMDDKAIRVLAERTVSVTMAESGGKAPTVIVDDRGIGQQPLKFSTTLLSLHLSDKPSKPYLIGQYGQGGASTFVHSKYTVFVSRRAPDLLSAGQEDLVGLAVVRFRPGAVRGGTYEYLTKGDAIFSVRTTEAPARFRDGYGTRVTHVAYNLHGFTSAYRQMKSGLWALLNAALFAPVMPVHIKGTRKIDTRGDKGATTTGRIAKGNAAVLSGLPDKPPANAQQEEGDVDDADDENSQPEGAKRRRGNAFLAFCDDTTTHNISDDDGAHGVVRSNIWVLGGTDSTDTYVRAEQAVTLTIAGQRHGKESREFLKTCKLGFLAKRVIVQIDADGLTPEAKRQAFPSGREQQRNTGIMELIFAELADYLKNHERLKELEDEARAQALANASSKARDSVRKKVAKLMQRHIAGMGGALGRASGSAVLAGTPGGPVGRTPGLRRPPQPRPVKPPPDDTALQPIPSQMEIANSQLTMQAGGRTHAVLHINAKNGYLGDHGDELRVEIVPVADSGDEGVAADGNQDASNGGDSTGNAGDVASSLGGRDAGGRSDESSGNGGSGNGSGAGEGNGTGGTGGSASPSSGVDVTGPLGGANSGPEGAGPGSTSGPGGRGGHGITVKGMGALRGGRARLVLGSDPTAVPGEYVVRVSLLTPGSSSTLVAVGTVEVLPAPAAPSGQELLEGGTPDIHWYEHPDDATSDEKRQELKDRWPTEWEDKNVVGDVVDSDDVFVFRLNLSYPELKQAIARRMTGIKGSVTAVDTLKDRYAAMVSFGMWLLHEQKKKDTAKWPTDVFQGACSALARSTLATMLESELDDDNGLDAA